MNEHKKKEENIGSSEERKQRRRRHKKFFSKYKHCEIKNEMKIKLLKMQNEEKGRGSPTFIFEDKRERIKEWIAESEKGWIRETYLLAHLRSNHWN